jgi:hypothetical protein
MDFKKMDYIHLIQLKPSELNQEKKEELLFVLESEIQRVKKETELLEIDRKVKQLQLDLIFATDEFNKLKDKSN